MHKVYISNNRWRQSLKRAHTNGAKNPRRKQTLIIVCKIRPNTTNKQEQIPADNHRSSTEFDRQSVGHEAADADGEDGPAQPAVQRVVRHVELLCHVGEAGRNHGAPGADDSGVDRYDGEEEFFFPARPVQGIAGTLAGLGNEDDIIVAAGAVFESGCVTPCTVIRTWSGDGKQPRRAANTVIAMVLGIDHVRQRRGAGDMRQFVVFKDPESHICNFGLIIADIAAQFNEFRRRS
jgi:hypothetical protein